MFRKILTFFVLGFILFGISSASAGSSMDAFYKGNDSYSKAKYQEAIDIYKSIEDQGVVSGELFYNMANAYLKLNNKGMAMLYYLRALEIMPRDNDLKENLAFLRNLLVDKVVKNKGNFLKQYICDIRDLFSLSEFLNILIFFYLILMGILIFWISFPQYSKFFILCSVVALPLFLFSGCFYFLRYHEDNIVNKAVVVSPKVSLFYSPAVSDNPAFVVHEGLVVVIEKHDKEWVHANIEGADMSGWIQQKDVITV